MLNLILFENILFQLKLFELHLKLLFQDILNGVLGIVDETSDDSSQKVIAGLMEMIIDIRKEAKANKDWATSDKIRDSLKALGVDIKDTKEGCEWSIE